MSATLVYAQSLVGVCMSMWDMANIFEYVVAQFTAIHLSLDDNEVPRTSTFRKTFIWYVIWEAEVSDPPSQMPLPWALQLTNPICRDLFSPSSTFVQPATHVRHCQTSSAKLWIWLLDGRWCYPTTMRSSISSRVTISTLWAISWLNTEHLPTSNIAGGTTSLTWCCSRCPIGFHWMRSLNSTAVMLIKL